MLSLRATRVVLQPFGGSERAYATPLLTHGTSSRLVCTLPLVEQVIRPPVGSHPGCIDDAAPDSWGQRVILN